MRRRCSLRHEVHVHLMKFIRMRCCVRRGPHGAQGTAPTYHHEACLKGRFLVLIRSFLHVPLPQFTCLNIFFPSSSAARPHVSYTVSISPFPLPLLIYLLMISLTEMSISIRCSLPSTERLHRACYFGDLKIVRTYKPRNAQEIGLLNEYVERRKEKG